MVILDCQRETMISVRLKLVSQYLNAQKSSCAISTIQKLYNHTELSAHFHFSGYSEVQPGRTYVVQHAVNFKILTCCISSPGSGRERLIESRLGSSFPNSKLPGGHADLTSRSCFSSPLSVIREGFEPAALFIGGHFFYFCAGIII